MTILDVLLQRLETIHRNSNKIEATDAQLDRLEAWLYMLALAR